MKKFVLECAAALLALTAFAESVTTASLAANVEKFMGGKGSYIKAGGDIDGTNALLYFPKDSIKSVCIAGSEGKAVVMFFGDINLFGERIPSIGFADIAELDESDRSITFPANDVSVDASGNLVFQKK